MIKNTVEIYDDEFEEMASAEFSNMCKIVEEAKINRLKRKATENLEQPNLQKFKDNSDNTISDAKINMVLFISRKNQFVQTNHSTNTSAIDKYVQTDVEDDISNLSRVVEKK